jgi:predicted ATPase/class 3 adenylate cyclase
MRCGQCRGENLPAAKFCGQCGARLEAPCPSCSHPNAPGAHFCTACGQPLDIAAAPPAGYEAPASYTPRHLADKVLTSRSALEGERKQVTVLFVDIVESSRLAERLDPEIMHQLMDRALRLMTDTVHRYEGTVNQFLGDGLMALFGAPLALEDHALRAVHAALGIQETVSGYNEQLKREQGVEIQLRLGLNSGLVVVGKIGDDLRMDYTAVGDTTNLAARMQGLAEPGTVLITEATHRLVHGYVRSEAAGPVQIKGRSEPVFVYRVTGRRRRRTRLEVSADRGLTELVGRERELATLRDCLARARAGRGQAVTIVGDPGVGKSRLIDEFRKSLGDESVTWLEGYCVAYGQTTPYLPLVDICKTSFHIDDGDNRLQIEEKLRQGIRRVDPGLERILPFLHELLGLPSEDEALRHLDPKDKRQKIFEALRALVLAGSRRRPHVFVLEDLHWIDKTSEECLAFAVESLGGLATLLVTTHRPGYTVRWTDKTYYTQIALDLLEERQVEAMVERLLGTSRVPPDLVRVVWEKAEGNPLFVEEIVRALRERGAVQRVGDGFVWAKGAPVEVPGAVQDIIRARLDRLDDPVKRTVQTAAVIGREFGLSVLSRVSETAPEVPHHLDTLKRLEIVHQTRFFPDVEFIFKHVVIQDVAYQTLLLQRRKQLHGAIGRAIEDLYADRLEEQAPILAFHYERSERQDRAIHYALLVGDRAARLYANADAATHYERALVMARALDASPDTSSAVIDATLKLAAVGGTHQDILERDRTNLESARALADELGDQARRARVLYWLGRTAYVRSQPAAALDYARQSLDIAERLGDDGLAAPPVNLMGRIYSQQSDYVKASELLERSVEQMRRLGNKAEESTAAGFAGMTLARVGEFARALAHTDRGLRLAQELQNPFAEAAAYHYGGAVRAGRGDWAAALEDLANACRIAERVGDLWRLYASRITETWIHTQTGDPARGRPIFEACDVLRAQIGPNPALVWQKISLATALLALGESATVSSLCEEAIRLAEGAGDRFMGALARRTLSEAIAQQDPASAERAILEAIEIQREIGTRPELAHSYVSYARLLRAGGGGERSRELLATAIAMFHEMGMTWDLEQALQALREA